MNIVPNLLRIFRQSGFGWIPGAVTIASVVENQNVVSTVSNFLKILHAFASIERIAGEVNDQSAFGRLQFIAIQPLSSQKPTAEDLIV